ncbi:MAG: RpiB/LacA/LacB family sugar-phosphate isomerase, partial [Christensenellaceae bacterium]|nr:RpiB/LacA/LacB family sugar-phosphate isomerase [Christensenellaceae bacterium]
TDASVDSPDYAAKVAAAIVAKDADLGIVMCGTGIGISIAANKIKGIRCAHVTDLFSATMCREHNNANVLSLGGRITSPENAALFTKTFLTTPFDSKNDRHSRRIDKIGKLES